MLNQLQKTNDALESLIFATRDFYDLMTEEQKASMQKALDVYAESDGVLKESKQSEFYEQQDY